MGIMEFLACYVDYIIFAILGFMSFLVVWFTIERMLFYSKVKASNYKSEVARVSAPAKARSVSRYPLSTPR